jgi:hypothetical protein
MTWKPHDPAWLIKLAREQLPEHDWLPAALDKCRSCHEASRAYTHFVAPDSPQWQFEINIQLDDPREGSLVLDVLAGNVIGGVEFLKRIS